MISVGIWDGKEHIFACDECGICEGLERRLRVAQEHPEYGDFQFDHCGCDKVGEEFWMIGYCGDAFVQKDARKGFGRRKTGREYRRKMHRENIQKCRNRDNWVWGVHVAGHWDGDEYILGSYIKRPKRSSNKVFFKRVSNKKVRRSKEILPKGNGYRRLFDYWWTID